ncbi:Uncharacterised protein [Vibrio cholerae]|nr:Uncharacterised protein [Vibrio cholerae]
MLKSNKQMRIESLNRKSLKNFVNLKIRQQSYKFRELLMKMR